MADESEIDQVRSASESGAGAFCALLEQHRERLKRLVDLRLDNRVRGRVDASDVIQETTIEAYERADEYLADPAVPVFVWLRFLAMQKVQTFHRRHLGTQARDAGREISLDRNPVPAATSAALAARLVGQLTSASHAAIRDEMKLRLEQALNQMDEKDRDVLALRHFEQLSLKETAVVLGLSDKAAGSRYLRALSKLRKAMNLVDE